MSEQYATVIPVLVMLAVVFWQMGAKKARQPTPSPAAPAAVVRTAVGGGRFCRCPHCRSTVPVGTGDDYCPGCGWVYGAPF